MNTTQLKQWLTELAAVIEDNRDELSKLDQALGDGDHGINMHRGFQAVLSELPNIKEEDEPAALLQKVATILISKVGGASGPLYGTAFLRMSAACKGKQTLDDETMVVALKQAAEGIAQRGKVAPGEGTLLDVWSTVANEAKETGMDWNQLEASAREGMEATKDMVVKRGRGAILGEQSVGHIDPGAVSSYYLFKTLCNTIKAGE